jgi:hypothetical protein
VKGDWTGTNFDLLTQELALERGSSGDLISLSRHWLPERRYRAASLAALEASNRAS